MGKHGSKQQMKNKLESGLLAKNDLVYAEDVYGQINDIATLKNDKDFFLEKTMKVPKLMSQNIQDFEGRRIE